MERPLLHGAREGTMTLTAKPVELAGHTYLLRYSARDLLQAEHALGRPLIAALQDMQTMTVNDLSTITRYGLHNTDMTPLSDEQYRDILENTDPTEFIQFASSAVKESFGKPAQTTGKN